MNVEYLVYKMKHGKHTNLWIELIVVVASVLALMMLLYIVMMVVAFVATYLFDVSAMLIIFVCLGIGLVDLYVTFNSKKKGKVS